MRLQPNLLVANRFRLTRLIGQGGMGSVWLAQHTELQIPCAVKFIEGETASREFRARFVREARAAAQLRSPNVVQVLDCGEWEGVPYMAMEFLEGEDLGARITRLGRLPPSECAEIVSQVARALTKAHTAGIVHRDLKPANVFLTRDDDRVLVKILDFGIAKHATALDDASTKTGALLGTPFYMSPEQVHGSKTVDFRSDLWALGVIAFQCLTGQRPFNAVGLGELFMLILNAQLPWPSQTVQSLPPAVDQWWFRAAARTPEGRFQSARELADQLGFALGISSPALGQPSLPNISMSGQPFPAVPMPSGPPTPTAHLGWSGAQHPAPHQPANMGDTTTSIYRPLPPPPQEAAAQSAAMLTTGGISAVASPPSGIAPPKTRAAMVFVAVAAVTLIGVAVLAMVAGGTSSRGTAARPEASALPAPAAPETAPVPAESASEAPSVEPSATAEAPQPSASSEASAQPSEAPSAEPKKTGPVGPRPGKPKKPDMGF